MDNRKYIQFSEICVSIYVRQGLSEERVKLFADLYTSSASGSVPPIIVTTDNKLVDGRHRIAALKFLGEQGCVCTVMECKDSLELTMAAMRANIGGSKELTMADIRQTILYLLNSGYSQKRVVERLPFPKELSRKLVKTAALSWYDQKAIAAARDVKEQKATVDEVSKKYGVQKRVVQKRVDKMNSQESGAGELSNVGSAKGCLTQKYYSLTTRMGNWLKRLIEKYEAGDYTEAQVREILAHLLHQARGHSSAMQDWNDRFDVMLKTRRPIYVNPMPPKKFVVSKEASVR